MTRLSAEQVLALAPDVASARASQELAVTRKWPLLGADDRAVWGECVGSGKVPYKAVVAMADFAVSCTCPSRKFPCKHGLGLLLLFAQSADAFQSEPPPQWASTWLDKRKPGPKREDEVAPSASNSNEPAESSKSSQREARVSAGIAELRVWLRDIVRQGIADVQAHGFSSWDTLAARMVDAQIPGVARYLREMRALPASGEGWQRRLMMRLSQLHLLAEGFEQRTNLSIETLYDIRTALGWPADRSALAPPVTGEWAVVGQREEIEDRLRAQRTWMIETTSGKSAMLLQFAHGQSPYEQILVTGMDYEASIAYYPGRSPIRATFRDMSTNHHGIEQLPFTRSVADAYELYTNVAAVNPWLERIGMALSQVVLVNSGDRWHLRDATTNTVPIHPKFNRIWQLVSASGGFPMDLFGEWDGEYLWPLTAGIDSRVLEI